MVTKKIGFYSALVLMGWIATITMGADPDWQHTGNPCFGVADSRIVFCENFDTIARHFPKTDGSREAGTHAAQ